MSALKPIIFIVLLSFALMACGGGESNVATLVPTAENGSDDSDVVSDESPRTGAPAPGNQIPPTWTPLPLPKTPTPLPTPEPDQTYVVQNGDTLAEIAEQFGVELDQLVAANDIQNVDVIHTGTVLVIPH